MIKLKGIITEIIGDISNIHTTNISTNNFSQDFINYIKLVENGAKVGFNKDTGLWKAYKDIAGWHIGYGHKLENNEIEQFKNGISEESVNKLLIGDLQIAKKRIDDYIKRVYKVNIPLSEKQEEMLLDFSFNLGGIDKFPKLVDAVLRNQTEIIKKEYIRKSGNKEIKGRNQAFYNRFLK